MLRNHKYILIFLVLSIFGVFSGSNDAISLIFQGTCIEKLLLKIHTGNSIIFSISIAYISSFIFWLLIVFFPERKKKNIIKKHFTLSYKYFKEKTIGIICNAAGCSIDNEQFNKLTNHNDFKFFFNSNMWDNVLNGLANDNILLDDLIIQLELLVSEIQYVLNNVEIYDENIFTAFKVFQSNIYAIKNSSNYQYEPEKYIGNILYEILGSYSRMTGKFVNDRFQELIDNI